MSRRRRPPTPPTPAKTKSTAFHTPFEGLSRALRGREVEPVRPALPAKPKPTAPVAPVPSESDDAGSFAAAMAGVRPIRADSRVDAPAPTTLATRTIVDEDAEALGMLADLVHGVGHFDISDSTEYVEGSVVGFDPRVLKRLRSGEFAYQSMIDLHGMSAAAARVEVERFVMRALAAGQRVVLIVHGRGLNSKDGVPVLKERLKSWLARGRIGRATLAFTSARPADGGTGALYVLLRRQRGAKEPMTVYEGAKRE